MAYHSNTNALQFHLNKPIVQPVNTNANSTNETGYLSANPTNYHEINMNTNANTINTNLTTDSTNDSNESNSNDQQQYLPVQIKLIADQSGATNLMQADSNNYVNNSNNLASSMLNVIFITNFRVKLNSSLIFIFIKDLF